jgi:hypothetical protein
LVWLDSCDKHRNEEIKQAAAVARISTDLGLERIQEKRVTVFRPEVRWIKCSRSIPAFLPEH